MAWCAWWREVCRFCAGTQFLNRGRLLSRMLADITLYITINDKAPPPLACWTCCRRRSGGGGAAKAGASRDQQRGWCGEVQRRGAEGAAVKISKRWHALEDRTGEVGRGKRTAAPPLLLAAARPPLHPTTAINLRSSVTSNSASPLSSILAAPSDGTAPRHIGSAALCYSTSILSGELLRCATRPVHRCIGGGGGYRAGRWRAWRRWPRPR